MNNKIRNSICPTSQELERIYDILAKKYGLSKIANRPIITIQTKGSKKNTLGWFWKDKWGISRSMGNFSEINICAEELSDKIIETLIHEMVHYHNASLNIRDCNEHQYHNKYFKERAESYGLNVEKSGRHGWNNTTISKTLQKILNQLKIKKQIFTLHRKRNIVITAKTKMKKYTCGCTIVRCATDLQAKCESCGNKFIQ